MPISKVQALANLYVAGSSVFASTGISDPTFTIITLSIRLAEHLIGVLGDSWPPTAYVFSPNRGQRTSKPLNR